MAYIEFIEEHNEAFRILMEMSSYGTKKYDLIHIDAHTDLSALVLRKETFQKLHDKKFSSEELKNITDKEITISSYITAGLEFNAINNVFYLSHKETPLYVGVQLIKRKVGTKFIALEPYCCRKNISNLYYTVTPKTNIGNLCRECVLSIDLDYFFTNNLEGESLEIDITEEQYMKLLKAPSKILLKFGNQFDLNKSDGDYRLKINLLEDFSDLPNRDPKSTINENAERLRDFLMINSKIEVQKIIVCSSVQTGYVSKKWLAFILNRLNEVLSEVGLLVD